MRTTIITTLMSSSWSSYQEDVPLVRATVIHENGEENNVICHNSNCPVMTASTRLLNHKVEKDFAMEDPSKTHELEMKPFSVVEAAAPSSVKYQI